MGKALFRNSCQRGLLTIFSSTGSKPLGLWDIHIQNGYYKRYMDPQLRSLIFEIAGNNVSTAYMLCPKGKNVLGIVMPYLIMVVKNLHKYWSFEITILDDDNIRRRFRASNFQSTTRINQRNTAMPICLADGWNQIQFNLADFTNRAYARRFCEVQKIQINANIGIRRIYFAERLVPDHELPMEYKLYLPLSGKPRRRLPMTNGMDEETDIHSPTRDITEETPQLGGTNEFQITLNDASKVANEPQETKDSEAELEEQKEVSHSKGSITSNVSANILIHSTKSITQPEVTSKQAMESKHSLVGSKTSKHSEVEPKTSKHSGSEIVEIGPIERGENNENEPGYTPPASQASFAKERSLPPGRLEDVPEENEEALLELNLLH